jgi:hypothetical protein
VQQLQQQLAELQQSQGGIAQPQQEQQQQQQQQDLQEHASLVLELSSLRQLLQQRNAAMSVAQAGLLQLQQEVAQLAAAAAAAGAEQQQQQQVEHVEQQLVQLQLVLRHPSESGEAAAGADVAEVADLQRQLDESAALLAAARADADQRVAAAAADSAAELAAAQARIADLQSEVDQLQAQASERALEGLSLNMSGWDAAADAAGGWDAAAPEAEAAAAAAAAEELAAAQREVSGLRVELEAALAQAADAEQQVCFVGCRLLVLFTDTSRARGGTGAGCRCKTAGVWFLSRVVLAATRAALADKQSRLNTRIVWWWWSCCCCCWFCCCCRVMFALVWCLQLTAPRAELADKQDHHLAKCFCCLLCSIAALLFGGRDVYIQLTAARAELVDKQDQLDTLSAGMADKQNLLLLTLPAVPNCWLRSD